MRWRWTTWRTWPSIDPAAVACCWSLPGNEALTHGAVDRRCVAAGRIDRRVARRAGDAQYRTRATAGYYDVMIFDQCRPEEMPNCNTCVLGTLPPDERWSSEAPQVAPQIIDLDAAHPLMMYLDFGNVTIAEARPVRGPAGQTVLLGRRRGAARRARPTGRLF